MPTAQAKQRSWELATGEGLSNAESRAVAAGFWRTGQDELLRPYVDRYVAELPGLWDARTPQVAGVLAQELFPSTLVEPDVHERTAVLEQQEHPAGLRRYVAEQRDDLRRALAARAVPGAPR
jgi:aminopeptidase N